MGPYYTHRSLPLRRLEARLIHFTHVHCLKCGAARRGSQRNGQFGRHSLPKKRRGVSLSRRG